MRCYGLFWQAVPNAQTPISVPQKDIVKAETVTPEPVTPEPVAAEELKDNSSLGEKAQLLTEIDDALKAHDAQKALLLR